MKSNIPATDVACFLGSLSVRPQYTPHKAEPMNSHQSRQPAARGTLAILVSMALAGVATGAVAQEADKVFSLSGFGTAGIVHSSIEKGDYVANLYEPKGAGYTDGTSATVDSKIGAQVDARLTDSLSAVVQVIMRQQPDGKFTPKIEWANVKYAITRDLSVRLGRTALPVFMVSETRQVGFANPWVRPPIETYSQFTLTNSDGVDLSYRHSFGAVSSTVQASYGKTKVDTIRPAGTITRDLKGDISSLGNTIEVGFLTVKLGWNKADFTLVPVPNRILKFQSKVVNLGAIYDPGNWFVQGEVTHSSLGTTSRATRNAYVTGGYRIGHLTPYLTYSMVTPDDDQVKLATIKQNTSSVGVRWDFHKNFDLKVQADHVSLGNGSTGLFTNVKTGLAGSSGTVLSAAVDFVF